MKVFVKSIFDVTLMIAILLGAMGICDYVETRYTRKECVVVDVQGTCVEVEDKSGYLWCYDVDDEEDAPIVGTLVDVKMYTNHTDSNIYDDIILKITMHE